MRLILPRWLVVMNNITATVRRRFQFARPDGGPDVQRFADAAHPAPRRAERMWLALTSSPTTFCSPFAAQIACHRPQSLRQHHRRSAVQQAKRLLCGYRPA